MSDRTDPFRDLEAFIERLNDAAGGGLAGEFAGGAEPPVDVLDRDDAFEVRVDLPGVDEEAIDLRLAGRTLHIRAEFDDEPEPDGTFVRQERGRDAVDRAVELPAPLDASGVTASLSDGVLTVTLPKDRPEGERLDIDIE